MSVVDANLEFYSNPNHVIGIFPECCGCLALAGLIPHGIRALLHHSNIDVRVTLTTSGLGVHFIFSAKTSFICLQDRYIKVDKTRTE